MPHFVSCITYFPACMTRWEVRLHSNLLFSLRQIFDAVTAQRIAQGLAALIDGFYIRHALQDLAPTVISYLGLTKPLQMKGQNICR